MKIVFAEFPEWKSLSDQDKNALFQQGCELWTSDRNKGVQLFDYLIKNEFDSQKLEKFINQQQDGELALLCAKKFLNPADMDGFDLEKAQKYVNLAIEKGCALDSDYKNCFSDMAVDMVSGRLEELNHQLSNSMYEKNQDEQFYIFFGEECAVLNQFGGVDYLRQPFTPELELQPSGLIIAKDEPVLREDFTTGDLPAELAECMNEIARKIAEDPQSLTARYQSFPNIIDFNAWFDISNFDDIIKYKKLEMQLLAHGWSLVEKKNYMLEFSEFLTPAVQETVADYRAELLRCLLDDDDDEDDEDDFERVFGNDEDDDDLDIDGIFDDFDPDKADDDDFDMDFSDLFEDEDDEDDPPAEKSGRKNKE